VTKPTGSWTEKRQNGRALSLHEKWSLSIVTDMRNKLDCPPCRKPVIDKSRSTFNGWQGGEFLRGGNIYDVWSGGKFLRINIK
jgi:hypothetical protein